MGYFRRGAGGGEEEAEEQEEKKVKRKHNRKFCACINSAKKLKRNGEPEPLKLPLDFRRLLEKIEKNVYARYLAEAAPQLYNYNSFFAY